MKWWIELKHYDTPESPGICANCNSYALLLNMHCMKCQTAELKKAIEKEFGLNNVCVLPVTETLHTF